MATSSLSQIAYLAGVFNWQVSDASYTPPGSKMPVSFHIVNNITGTNLENYFQGAINTYNLISNTFSNKNSNADPNLNLYNTKMQATSATHIFEKKLVINRIPYANRDQIVPMGCGGENITFNVIFAGTMYQTAFLNFIQAVLQDNLGSGSLGTLNHPFFGNISNVTASSGQYVFENARMQCIILNIVFRTSDLSHLKPNIVQTSTQQTINKYYTGVTTAVSSISSTITNLKTLKTNATSTFGKMSI